MCLYSHIYIKGTILVLFRSCRRLSISTCTRTTPLLFLTQMIPAAINDRWTRVIPPAIKNTIVVQCNILPYSKHALNPLISQIFFGNWLASTVAFVLATYHRSSWITVMAVTIHHTQVTNRNINPNINQRPPEYHHFVTLCWMLFRLMSSSLALPWSSSMNANTK